MFPPAHRFHHGRSQVTISTCLSVEIQNSYQTYFIRFSQVNYFWIIPTFLSFSFFPLELLPLSQWNPSLPSRVCRESVIAAAAASERHPPSRLLGLPSPGPTPTGLEPESFLLAAVPGDLPAITGGHNRGRLKCCMSVIDTSSNSQRRSHR